MDKLKYFFKNLIDSSEKKEIIEIIKSFFLEKKWKPFTETPYNLKNKNCFPKDVMLPFSKFQENEIMYQYLIFSKLGKKENFKNEISTPQKNILKNLNSINRDINELNIVGEMEIDEKEKMDISYEFTEETEETEKIEIKEEIIEEINEEIVKKKKEKPVKFLIGVSGIGKTSYVVSKIFQDNYLIYLSCGDAKNSSFQIYDSTTDEFISKCKIFDVEIDKYLNNLKFKNDEEKKKKKRFLMVNYVSYYFLLRLILFLYEKECLNLNSKKIFYSQINGNSNHNSIIFDLMLDYPEFYDNSDVDNLIKKFEFLINENIIFALDELQLLTTLLAGFCGRNNFDSLRSLLSIFLESISKFYFLERYLLGTGITILSHDEIQSGIGSKITDLIERSISFLSNEEECYNYLSQYVNLHKKCKNLDELKLLIGRKRISSSTLSYLNLKNKKIIYDFDLKEAIIKANFLFKEDILKRIKNYFNTLDFYGKQIFKNALFFTLYKISNYIFFFFFKKKFFFKSYEKK
jgi:hypothetical protein